MKPYVPRVWRPPARRRQSTRPKVDLDPTARLLAEAAAARGKISWGPDPAQNPDARRRKVDLLLEKHGLKPPSRW